MTEQNQDQQPTETVNVENIQWRLEFDSSADLLLSMKELFSLELINELFNPNLRKGNTGNSSAPYLQFWLATAHSLSVDSSTYHYQVKSKGLRSICLEFALRSNQGLSQKIKHFLTTELRNLGWIRFKKRQDEVLSPFYSWQQFLFPQKVNLYQQNPSFRARLDQQWIDIQCKFIGTQKQSSFALTQALKVAQKTQEHSTEAYQLRTLEVASSSVISAEQSDLNLEVFCFVFVHVDHYFLAWLESQEYFLVDLVFPSLFESMNKLDHLDHPQRYLITNIWSNSKFYTSSDLQKTEGQLPLYKSDLLINEVLRWSPTPSATQLKNQLDQYLTELDAFLVKKEVLDELREYISSLKPLYAEVYSVALLAINGEHYYFVNLAKRPISNRRDHPQGNHNGYWTEEHLRSFKGFLAELKAHEVYQAIFLTCISKQPLLYLGLESELLPKLNKKEQIELFLSKSKGQVEGQLSVISPFIGDEKQDKDVELFQVPKPRFYRSDESSLILYPKRLSRIRQWFDESFICLSPSAFDDE